MTPTASVPRNARDDLRADAVAGFLVFLIALPLCLGIAMASGFPPIAGIVTAVVGGVVATFAGSARLTIKGPAAGLIVIALGAVQDLGGGDAALGYRRALGVGVVAAVVQIALASARLGKLGELFPSSVVHGMLAAIGVIIVSKQTHTLLGVGPSATSPIGLLAEIPHSVLAMNPEIAALGALSLAVLFAMPRLPFAWAKRVPAPLVVLALAIPLGRWFDLGHEHTYTLGGHAYPVGPSYLVQLPGTILSSVSTPDFSAVLSLRGLQYVVMFALVGSIESVLSAKAVDALDPERRRSDLDRDLLSVGVGNLVASALGGLPMISEIVRSSANVNAGARSRWSNFFHGAFLLAFVTLVPGLLRQIPMAVLGAMLVYTGLRLASPEVIVKTWHVGREQLAIFVTTLVATLATDLLVGVGAGIAVKLAFHVWHGGTIRGLFGSDVERREEGGVTVLRVRTTAVFTNFLGIERHLASASGDEVVLDLSGAQLVDHTTQERLHDLCERWARDGKQLVLRGLDAHEPLSGHHLATRRLPRGARIEAA